MEENTLVEFSGRAGVCDPLTDLPRKGAHQLPRAAVASGLETFLAEFSIRRLPNGRAAVVRNGHHPERAVQTGIGPVTVQNPKVRSKTGTPVTFHSALVPPCVVRHGTRTLALCINDRPGQGRHYAYIDAVVLRGEKTRCSGAPLLNRPSPHFDLSKTRLETMAIIVCGKGESGSGIGTVQIALQRFFETCWMEMWLPG